MYKIVLAGHSGVGKTACITRIIKDTFKDEPIMTCGMDYSPFSYESDNSQIQLNFWDTAGQERYRSITTNYLRGASLVYLVIDSAELADYSQRNESVSDQLRYWTSVLEKDAPNAPIILVINKIDLIEEEDLKTRVDSILETYNEKFKAAVCISAKTGKGVKDGLLSETCKLLQTIPQQPTGGINTSTYFNHAPQRRGSCCSGPHNEDPSATPVSSINFS